jgi:hypothetical protein
MLEFKLQTPVNHPEESMQHSEHGKSVNSRMDSVIIGLYCIYPSATLLSSKTTPQKTCLPRENIFIQIKDDPAK